MIYIYNKLFIISETDHIEKYFKDNNIIFIKLNNIVNIYKTIKNYYCDTLIYITNNIDYKLIDKCRINNINIQCNFYINEIIYNINIYNKLQIKISSLNEIESNLLIESIEYNYPILVKLEDKILYKCNTSLDFCKYYKYIVDYSVSKYNNSNLYLCSVNNNFLKIEIQFTIINNTIKILEIFKHIYNYINDKILYVDLEYNKSIQKYFLEYIKKIIKSISLNNIICSIYFIHQNNNFYYYNFKYNINFIKYYDYYKKIYNLDIYNIYLSNNNIIQLNNNNNNNNNNILFFDLNNTIDFHIIKDNIYYLLKNKLNIYNKIDTNYTYIKNINIKKNICKIYNNNNNNNINIKYPKECIDIYNSKLSNIILNNTINEKVIECSENMFLYFYNNTNICFTGKDIKIYINDKKYNTYKIIKINKFDSIKIINNTNNKYYISFSNGIKNLNILHNELIYNKSKTNFNIIKNFNPIHNNKINFIIDKNKFEFIFKKYKWYVNNINNDNIIFKTKSILNFSINNKIKKYKYPIGSIIIKNNCINIIRNYNFDYCLGIYIGCIIYTDIWKLNYLNNNEIINFNNVSYDYSIYKINKLNLIFNNLINNKNIIINNNYNNYNNNTKKEDNYLFNYKDEEYNIEIYSKLFGDKYIIIIYRNNNTILNLIRFRLIMEKYNIIQGNNFYILNIEEKDKTIIDILKYEKNISNIQNINLTLIEIPILIKNNNININFIFVTMEIYKNKTYIKNENNKIFVLHNNTILYNKKIIGYIIYNNSINKILNLIKFKKYKDTIYNSILYNYNKNNYYFNKKNINYNIKKLVEKYK
jgi:allophanate hydrolase subunit 2